MEIVGNVEKGDLIEIICFLVNKNPKLERNLLEYCQKNSIFENKMFITEQQLLQGWENSKKLINEFFIMSTKLARQKIICFRS